LEPVEVHEGLVKALLHHVLSVLSIAGYPEREREGPCFMSLHQKFEGLTLSIPYRCD
jgi:hypothetical protein